MIIKGIDMEEFPLELIEIVLVRVQYQKIIEFLRIWSSLHDEPLVQENIFWRLPEK